jgi:glycosyltransferase involved in cell wall biosynthesis
MHKIKITIIIATFNEESRIKKTLDSIYSQENLYHEIIIKDADSNDNTIKIIQENKKNNLIILQGKDKGIYDAWNIALKRASGNWVLFLGAGDTLSIDCLKSYIDFIQKNSYCDFISSKIRKVDANDLDKGVYYTEWNWRIFQKYMNTSHVGALHNMELFTKHGYFNLNYKICSDYEFLLRIGNNLNPKYINRVQANMLIGGMSESINAINETRVIKQVHTNRNTFLINFEFYMAVIKFYTRKLYM